MGLIEPSPIMIRSTCFQTFSDDGILIVAFGSMEGRGCQLWDNLKSLLTEVSSYELKVIIYL